jgi:hypothetical protein
VLNLDKDAPMCGLGRNQRGIGISEKELRPAGASESDEQVVEVGGLGELCRPLCEVLTTGLPEGANQAAIGAKSHIPRRRPIGRNPALEVSAKWNGGKTTGFLSGFGFDYVTTR